MNVIYTECCTVFNADKSIAMIKGTIHKFVQR